MELRDDIIHEVVSRTPPGQYCIAISGMRMNDHPSAFGVGIMNAVAIDTLIAVARAALRAQPRRVEFLDMLSTLEAARLALRELPS